MLTPIGELVTSSAAKEQTYFVEDDCYMVFECTSSLGVLMISTDSIRTNVDKNTQEVLSLI